MAPLGASPQRPQRLESRDLSLKCSLQGRCMAVGAATIERMSISSETEQVAGVAATFAERRQALEEAMLSPLAARSYPAKRVRAEEDCGLRTPFQRDRDRIVHCKAFRRLTHKTQVFVAPEGDHYRTRLTHTLEVTQVSRTVARALRLNEDLTEAIGLGHDLGTHHLGTSVGRLR